MHNLRTRDNSNSRFLRLAAMLLSVFTFFLYAVVPGISYAGKEGVFISDSVYFTLEDVTISQGSDAKMMRFNVKLNNDGGSSVDFNRYGVKVTSSAGGSYYAALSQKAEAQVAPYSSVNYYYVATVPAAVDSAQLQVTIYERSGSSLQDIGSLSVSNAQSLREQAHQLVLNMADVDSTLSSNAFVSFQAVKGAAIPKDGKWDISVDVAVSTTGSESITMPTALKYYLHDGQGRTFSMTANAVDGTTINSGQTKHVVLTSNMDDLPANEALTLEVSSGDSGIASLGQLSLSSILQPAQMGEQVSYVLQGREGVTLEVQKAEERKLPNNKKEAVITAVLHNNSKNTMQAPTLTGTLVSKEDAISVAAGAATTPETYIASGEAGAYRFVLQIPNGASADSLQFVATEQRTSSSSSSSTTSSSTSSGTTAAGSQTNAIPLIAVSLKGGVTAVSDVSQVPVYELGNRMTFDSGSHLIDPNLEVSVVELNGHTDDESGYQTVIAKFKFVNKSNETLSLPVFGTSLTDTSGTTYTGNRQTTTLTELIPNSAYVYSYSYLLPPSATGSFKLSILDTSSTAKVSIADTQVTVGKSDTENPYEPQRVLQLYPYTVKLNYWTLGYSYNSSADTYTYKIRTDLDIAKIDQVIADDSFSTLEFDLVDSEGRKLVSTTKNLQGTSKLVSGIQNIVFDSVQADQLNEPLSIKVYETTTTANGTAKRLIATLK